MEVIIDEKWLETAGTSTLQGQIFNDLKGNDEFPKEITLIFAQTPMWWRRQHDGANHWIVPEYAISCLLESVLSMQEHGVKVTIKTADQVPQT